MIAAQLIAAHNAAIECYRRAMLGEQSVEGRRDNLTQANKLSRTYATLLEALNRHRGKGQQKVTVEHVHVHAGGQAIVGMVETPGGGDRTNRRINPMHSKLPMHLGPRCGARTRKASEVPITGDAEWSLPHARGKSPGAPKGNRNAWKHGHYSAEAIALRRHYPPTIVRRGRPRGAVLGGGRNKRSPGQGGETGASQRSDRTHCRHAAGDLRSCAYLAREQLDHAVWPRPFGLGSRSWAEGNTREPSGAQS